LWSNWKAVNGTIPCSTGAFGRDPYPNQAKACECRSEGVTLEPFGVELGEPHGLYLNPRKSWHAVAGVHHSFFTSYEKWSRACPSASPRKLHAVCNKGDDWATALDGYDWNCGTYIAQNCQIIRDGEEVWRHWLQVSVRGRSGKPVAVHAWALHSSCKFDRGDIVRCSGELLHKLAVGGPEWPDHFWS
jgi:hypothetical protein